MKLHHPSIFAMFSTADSSRTEVTDDQKERVSDLYPSPANDEENAVPPSDEDEKGNETGSYEVDWDGPDDKTNPRNWNNMYKAWITFQLGMLALAASLGSSIIAPAETEVARYVGVSKEVSVLTISLYV